MSTLKFSKTNRKLRELGDYLGIPKSHVVGFDLPAGHTCPAAKICKSMANRETGKITDGKDCQFRCYAASIEAFSPSARDAHWHNFDALQGLSIQGMASLISDSLPKRVEVVRIHASGDFFSKAYFLAWVEVAKMNPDIIFFGYTKMLPFVSMDMPDNMSLVYSYGGIFDDKVTDEPFIKVVETVTDALALGLTPACQNEPSDDFDYIRNGQSFALTIHGTQPAKGG